MHLYRLYLLDAAREVLLQIIKNYFFKINNRFTDKRVYSKLDAMLCGMLPETACLACIH